MHVVHLIWNRVGSVQPAPGRGAVLVAGVIAAGIVGFRRSWRVSRHAVTIAHEAAHGVTALVGGRRLAGIRLHSDTSGVTLSRGRPDGAGMVAMLAAGYLGPAAVGLAAAGTVAAGHAVALLWGLLVLLALVLLQIRNLFGLWSVLVTGVVVFAASWGLPGTGQSLFASVVTWFLLLAAPRPVLELIRTRSRHQVPVSDPDQLARITPLPAGAWITLLLVGTVGALVAGAALLLG